MLLCPSALIFAVDCGAIFVDFTALISANAGADRKAGSGTRDCLLELAGSQKLRNAPTTTLHIIAQALRDSQD
jgi:hypothetical protein